MATVLLSDKKKILWPSVTCLLLLIVTTTNAKVKGYFKCTKPPKPITCHAVDLPTVHDGYFNCSGYYVGDKCNLTCNHGYYPSSPKETVCERRDDFNGTWRGRNFQCSATSCKAEDLPTIQSGYFNCSGYSVGGKCNLTCNHGYYPLSSKEIICEERNHFMGNWSDGNFQCSDITCHTADLPTVQAGYFNCSGYSVGDSCNLTCNHGYYPSSSKETVCEEKDRFKGNWSDRNFQCFAVSCHAADLPIVQAGYFNCSGYSVGDKCNLTCNHGYYPPSSKAIVCEKRNHFMGNWSDGNFQCSAITCHTADLPTVQAGSFNCSGYSVGDKCNLTCNHGYYPSLSEKTVCEEKDRFKGNWSDGNFQCSAISCPADGLPIVESGDFNCSGYSVGDKCNLTCNHGYYSPSSKEIVCEERNHFMGKWSDGKFQCSAITCQEDDLPTVQDGSFECSLGNAVGRSCYLECSNGYYPLSEETVCEERENYKGKWSDGNFQCYAIMCQEDDLPTVQDGIFNCSQGYSVGRSCYLECNNGYYPLSSEETVCEEKEDFMGNWSDGNFQCYDCSQWNEWDGKEYRFINSRQSREESRLLCENDRAQLVIIKNKMENDFLYKMLSHCSIGWVWIGLNDFATEGTWVWGDQTEVSYTNWDTNNPTNGHNYNCVRMDYQSGKWRNYRCTYKIIYRAVCERNKSS